MRFAHNDYIQDVNGASLLDGGNHKKFWSFVRLNRTESIGIPILSDTDGLHITSQAKAECLIKQFASVYMRDNGTDIIDKGPSPYSKMDNIRFMQPGI